MFKTKFFADTLTSNNILFEVTSCNLPFIFDRPMICKTVKYIDQSDNSLGSCHLPFIFDCPMICKTVKYIDQSDNSLGSCHHHVTFHLSLTVQSYARQLNILTNQTKVWDHVIIM